MPTGYNSSGMKLAHRITIFAVLFLALLIVLQACVMRATAPGTIDALWTQRAADDGSAAGTEVPDGENMAGLTWQPPLLPLMTPHRTAPGTPTPDAPHALPALRSEPLTVTVQAGETLREIARRYQVSLAQLVESNALPDPNLLATGQTLQIPLPAPQGDAPAAKIIPDSEFVYGPASAGWNISAFMAEHGGALADAEFEGKSAAAMIEEICRHYSVNPRLLLAVMDYQYGWLSNGGLPRAQSAAAHSEIAPTYRIVENAAANLSLGYYLWKAGGVRLWALADGSVLNVSPVVNAGTAAVQAYYAEFYGFADWEKAVGPEGLAARYTLLFGSPWDYALEPALPPDLTQPDLRLPFEDGAAWSFTGGPHGGWSSTTAWAALDFAPATDETGCVPSDAWVTAAADGLIVFSDDGEVIQDLDGDGYWQSGWSILYMHVSSQERVPAGTFLQAGERIGHPSCEGGVSSGTHLHIARRYDGEWIPADRDLPFVLDGWVSAGTGVEYDGTLTRAGTTLTAFGGRAADNEIQR